MKKFTLSKKLKEKAQAPESIELERPEAKEYTLRKWFIRLAPLVLIGVVLYFIFKDVFFLELDGLIVPEKVKYTSPIEGRFIAYAKVGDVVEPNKVIGKIYNPSFETEKKVLSENLQMYTMWKEKLKNENFNRKKLNLINQEIAKLNQISRIDNPESIKKEIELLKRNKELLLKEEEVLKKKISDIEDLIKIGGATEGELLAVRKDLVKIQLNITSIDSKINKLYDRLAKLTPLVNLLKKESSTIETNPLLPNLIYLERDISSLKSKLNILDSKSSVENISFPFRAKIASILPSNSFISSGVDVVTVFNIDSYKIVAYALPEDAKQLSVGMQVSLILPSGEKLEGIISGFGSTLVLKPTVLVSPLEKRKLVLPVMVKLPQGEILRREMLYENMPVKIRINK